MGQRHIAQGVGSESERRSWPELVVVVAAAALVIGYKCESSYAFCSTATDTPESSRQLLPLVRQVTKNRTLNLAWLGSNWFAMGIV